MALFDQEDYNGECFIAGSEGERQELLAHQVVALPREVPADVILGTKLSAVPEDDRARYMGIYENFFKVNVHALLALPEAVRPTQQAAVRISYLRLLALREGLFKPRDDPAAHHCRYSDFAVVGEDLQAAAAVDNDGNRALWALLTREMRHSLRRSFTDSVCIVAYFFRTRGHHWLENFDARYKQVWRRCLYAEDTVGLEWRYVARHAFHAIYPDDLDAFWARMATQNLCAGTLAKRFTCAPAGIAGVAALERGVDDLRMVLPRVVDLVPDAVAELERVHEAAEASRWGGSVNSALYGVQRIRADEGRLGSLASVVLAAVRQFAADSPLKDSVALARIASAAPVTGGVVAVMIQKAVTTERAALALVPDVARPLPPAQ